MKKKNKLALEFLFKNHTREEFIEQWHKGKWLKDVNDLPNCKNRFLSDDLYNLEKCLQVSNLRCSAMAHGEDDTLKTIHGISAQEAQKLYGEGYSIQIIDCNMPLIHRFAGQLAIDLGIPIGSIRTRLVFSPPHATTAYGWHFDGFDNILVQIYGSKRWLLAPCTTLEVPISGGHPHKINNNPRRDSYINFPDNALFEYYPGSWDQKDFENAESILIEAGDSLFNPRGIWHRTYQVGKEGSVSIVFEIRPLPWYHATHLALFADQLPKKNWRESTLQLLSPNIKDEDRNNLIEEYLNNLKQTINELDTSTFFSLYCKSLSGNIQEGSNILKLSPKADSFLSSESNETVNLVVIKNGKISEISFPQDLISIYDWLINSECNPFKIETILASNSSICNSRNIDPEAYLKTAVLLIKQFENIGLLESQNEN